MFRFLPYIALFFTAVLSQILLFDNLTVGVLFSPYVYILFLILLPLETPRVAMLGLGILLGFVIDAMSGGSGVHSIATIFIAFFRTPILYMLFSKARALQRGVPSELLIGYGDFILYIAVIVLLHHVVLFGFSLLSFDNWQLSLVRYLLSSVVSMLYIWLMARLFTINNLLK